MDRRSFLGTVAALFAGSQTPATGTTVTGVGTAGRSISVARNSAGPFVVESFSPNAGIWNTKEHGHENQLWFSSHPTVDGNIVDMWGHGHIPTASNAVWLWDPDKPATFTYVYKNNNGAYGWQMYDNSTQWYNPVLNMVICPGEGACDLNTGTIVMSPVFLRLYYQYLREHGPDKRSWPGAQYGEVVRNSLTFNAPERYTRSHWLYTPVARGSNHSQLDWNAVKAFQKTSDHDLIYPHDEAADRWLEAPPFNTHFAWSPTHDVGIALGGGNSGRFGGIALVVPMAGTGQNRPQRYLLYVVRLDAGIHGGYPEDRAIPTGGAGQAAIDGHPVLSSDGRQSACCLGDYFYWYGGSINGPMSAPLFDSRGARHQLYSRQLFRLYLPAFLRGPGGPGPRDPLKYITRLAPRPRSPAYDNDIIGNLSKIWPTSPPTPGSDGYRRLAAAAEGVIYGLLCPIPELNALIAIDNHGIAAYDIHADRWFDITPKQYTDTCNAGRTLAEQKVFPYPRNNVGGYVQRQGKIYWFGGGYVRYDRNEFVDYIPGPQRGKVFSLKVSRVSRVGYIPILGVQQSPALSGLDASFNPFANHKHTRFLEHAGYIWIMSGDFGQWPHSPSVPGYRVPETTFLPHNSVQNGWRLSIADAVARGARFELSQNLYHNYPWDEVAGRGHFHPPPEKGPYCPDAYGWVVDRRGVFWMSGGPGGYDAIGPVDGEIAGRRDVPGKWLQWRMPDVYVGTDRRFAGIRLGGSNDGSKKGWHLPLQDDPPALVLGQGRVGDAVYDPENDCIPMFNFGPAYGGTQWGPLSVYRLSCIPDTSGRHRVSNLPLLTLNGVLPWPTTHRGIAAQTVSTAFGDSIRMVRCGREVFFFRIMHAYHATESGQPTRFLVSFRYHLDKHTVEPFPLPRGRWWSRVIDGPMWEQGLRADLGATATQYCNLAVVGTKVVVGPDVFLLPGTDPMMMIYDTATRQWSEVESPADRDVPLSLYNTVGVESLGEVWIIGSLTELSITDPRMQALGLGCTADAGRRIVRVKI